MKKCFLLLLLTISISSFLLAQKNKDAAKCNCKYPFKSLCWDFCVKKLLRTNNFKEAIKERKLSDSGRLKVEQWINDTENNQSLRSILNKKDMAKMDAALDTYFDNPDNIQMSTPRLMHGMGATISVLLSPPHSSNFTLSQENFTYFPRYNLTEGENSSLSVGVPVGIGVGIARNTYGNDAGIVFAYELPVVIDFNFGCKSTRKTESTFGGYVGAGFGYYHVSISQSAYSDFSGATYGPMGRLGFRFGKEGWDNKAFTVGLFYKKGLEEAKLQTIGFNVLYDF